jgi:very-short-patch-repair endonuclease
MPVDITAQIEAWRKQLLDTTKRNRLINFKVGRTGGVALLHPDPGDLWRRLLAAGDELIFAWKRDLIELPPDSDDGAPEGLILFNPAKEAKQETGPNVLDQCLHSPRLRSSHLLTEMTDRQLAARLARFALNSRESLTEQGVTTLYVAFGFLRWFESPDSQVEIRSPLLLVPVRLERDSVGAPWKLQAQEEDVLPNHSLAHLLAADFRLQLPVPQDDEAAADNPGWRLSYFGEVQRCVGHQPRWDVLDEAALGTFSFQKLAMWGDLGRNRDQIAGHPLCRAVAGDPDRGTRQQTDLPGAKDLDRQTHPARTFHILDADSSQHEAIAAATRGASLVLDGPPGTGKSQTIANVIAEFLAAGKTVLFVSEKAAALEVVQRRLQDRGLGDFCLACHSHKENKREVVAELSRCLSLAPENGRDMGEELQELLAVRRQLNEYVQELHAVRPPLNLTVFQAQGELARLSRLGSRTRCPISGMLERDAAYLTRVTALLNRLPDCQSVIADRERHPWRGCRAAAPSLTLADEVRHHFRRLAACLESAAGATAALHELGFCVDKPRRVQWLGSAAAAREVLACPPAPRAWFQGNPRFAAEAIVQIDQLSREYRQTLAALPEFAVEALRSADSDALAGADLPASGPRLIPWPGDTVKTLRRRLTAVGDLLLDLNRRTSAVDQAARRVGELLRVSIPPRPISALSRLTELADLVARVGPVLPSWWDAGRRKELLAVFDRCRGEAQAAREARVELSLRLTPRAFAPESAASAARAGWFRSFLARLLPRWWGSLKPQLSGWYIAGPPHAEALLDDMRKLSDYHRRTDYCRQVREQYSADLLTGAGGEPDWDRTLEGLRAVERLTQLLKVPSSIQAALTGQAGLDRAALAAAGKELAKQGAALRQRIDQLGREYDLTEATGGTSGQVRLTAGELDSWLNAQADLVRRRALLLEKVSTLLADGQDVSAEALPSRLRSLGELGRLRLQIKGYCDRVWPNQPPQGVEERDWLALRGGAEALLRLLDKWRGVLPAPVVQALTVPQVRARLAEAVRRSETAYAGGFEESWGFLDRTFDLSRPVSTGLIIEETPLADLRVWLTERAADAHCIYEWTQFCAIEREIAQAGATPVLEEVFGGQVKPEEAGAAFRTRFLGLWLDAVYQRVPALWRFASDSHERLIGRFRDLDRRAVASAAARIRSFQLSRPERPRLGTGDPPGSSELGVLLREINKKRRHLPLRKLFAAVPKLLLRLKPCLMMSPLAVSTYLDTPDIHFDLVIFDEASQVRPYDAICAIYRGRQLIVAGDQKQLPPTSFFDRAVADEAGSDDEDGSAGGLEDYESILDVCCTLGLPRRRLRWHYRSRREGLIAFANQFIYGNELVTFPSVYDVAGNPAVAFENVKEGRWKAGAGGGFNAVEARRTAELVLDHFRQRPDESLGVIAFSQRQQMRILDELEQMRKANPDLEGFFDEHRDEAFFVKNLENVQGDERDVIFLGIGYGPDETGRVAMRFGPLNRQGGERRLNVAVTRARRGMTVVSSMRAGDIDLNRAAARGVELLRAYLDYAERGPEALTGALTVSRRGFDSPFEQEVYEELTRRGLTVHPQVGCSSFFIDLAVVDPAAPGRYLLGVECDGASYHSSATARDRDRLRQEVLEGLGWRVCRIWSTDWLRGRENQVRRVLAALEAARRDGGPPPRAASSSPAARSESPPAAPDRGAASTDDPVEPSYDSIDEVPENILREAVLQLLKDFGATEASELIQAVARRLGFKRTGKRIQARIEERLEQLIKAGRVCRTSDQRLQAAPTAQAAGETA